MTPKKTERTVPIPPAATDGEQPVSYETKASIAGHSTESNTQRGISEDELLARLREMERRSSPDYLHTVTLTQLLENSYMSSPPVMDGLLYPGTYILAGASKVGKSFLVAQIAYHVSMGLPLWNYSVRQGSVLYLALEDDYSRLQQRLYRMYGTTGTDALHFAVYAKALGNGLEGQLRLFLREHRDTRMIIIDVLQKVRQGGEQVSYAEDYNTISSLKQLAGETGICVLIVHHTRKQPSGDPFDMISGSTGLLGASDGSMLLRKERRTDTGATLEVTGRDQQDQRIYLQRDMESLCWTLDHVETELWKEPLDPILEQVAALVTVSAPTWEGSATELAAALQADMKPNALAMRLNVRAGRLFHDYGIRYESRRTHTGRSIRLTLELKQS